MYRPQGWLSPVLCVDGRIAGVWRQERKGAALNVAIEPFATLRRGARREAGEQAELLAALADFLGGELELSFTA